MSNASNFNNFALLQPWFTPRFLHPLVVVESSESVNSVALKNGVDFVQLLRPFSTCQGSIISRTDERRKQVMTTYPFGVRLTKTECVKSLGNYLVSVTEEHLRHLMIENEKDAKAVTTPEEIHDGDSDCSPAAQWEHASIEHADRGTALDAVLQRALLQNGSGSSNNVSQNIHSGKAEQPYYFPSWPSQTEHEKLRKEKGGPLPRPQYIEGSSKTVGVSSPQSPSSPLKAVSATSIQTSDAAGSAQRNAISELDVLMQSAVPAWYPAFLQDFHSLVRCGHMDTIDHPVGIIYAVSTREGLGATSKANPAWKMTVMQAIRNELLRQYENVQRIWQDSPMMDREVHSFFILVHDDDHFTSSDGLHPLTPNEVGDILKECQSMCGTLPHMKNTPGYDGGRRGDCWTLLTLNSAENPLRQTDGSYNCSTKKESGFAKGGVLDPMRWVDANPPSSDIPSEEGLDAMAGSSPSSALHPSQLSYVIQHAQLAHKYPSLSKCVQIASTPSPSLYKTYFLPFQWKRRLVRPICGSWHIQYAPEASGIHDGAPTGSDALRNIILPKYTGCYLTEENIMDIQSSMTSYMAHHLARFIERRVCQLSASISQRRTTTLGKVAAWFKSEEAKPRPEVVLVTKPGSRGGGQVRLRYTSIEMQMRRCADYCLFLQDFDLAQTNYKLCRDELLESVQNRSLVQPLLGGVQEALSICQFYLMQTPHPLPALAPPYVPSTAHKPTAVNPSTTPLVADSISNPKCYNVCRLEIAQSDYLYASTADNGNDDYLRSYVFKIGLLLFEMCRLHRHPRPAMDRAAVVLSNLLVTGIPKNSSHVWNAVVHQLLAGVYLCMNPPRPLSCIRPLLEIPSSYLLSSSLTAVSSAAVNPRDWPVQSHLRRFIYHLHEAGSHWFVECTQRPSSAHAALYCYRRLFICCKSLLHDESVFAAIKNISYEPALDFQASKQRGSSNRREYWHLTAQRCRNGWRAMLDDIVGKLVFLLLPQQQHHQRERQHLSLLSSPNSSTLVAGVTTPSGIGNREVEERERVHQQQQQKAEALAILTFAVAHNIRCHLDQAGKESVLKDVQLLFELQHQCNLLPPCFMHPMGASITSFRNSSAGRMRSAVHGLIEVSAAGVSPLKDGVADKEEKNDSSFISGCMILPLIDPNSLIVDLEYYKMDQESKEASRRARVSVGDLLNKEWSLTEETLRHHYQEQSTLKSTSQELHDKSLCIPSHVFPPYVGEAASLRVGIPGAREHMMKQMKLNKIHYPTSPLMNSMTSPTKDEIFHSRTASPSMSSLSIMIGGANPGGSVVPPILFTVPQEQCIWLSLSMVNPLEIPLLLKDLCLVYVIEEETIKDGVEVEDGAAKVKELNLALDDEYQAAVTKSNSVGMEGETLLEGGSSQAGNAADSSGDSGFRREYKTGPSRSTPGNRHGALSKESDDGIYTTLELLPFQQKVVRIPFHTAHLPCGPIQIIGLSWSLHLLSQTGVAISSAPRAISYEGRYYFATAMKGGAPPCHPSSEEPDPSEKVDRWNASHAVAPSLSSFPPAFNSLSYASKSFAALHAEPFLQNRQGDAQGTFLFHSLTSTYSVLNAPENIRLGITPARAAITAKFSPPLPESLYDGEVFSTTLFLRNHSTLTPNEDSHNDNYSFRYARHVTLQLSPDNGCLLYVEGFSQSSMYATSSFGGSRQRKARNEVSDSPYPSSTFVVAECIAPGESISLRVILRGRYHSVAQAASSSSSAEPCCNDVMLLVGYIPSSSQQATELSRVSTKEDLFHAAEKPSAAYTGRGKSSKMTSSDIFPLPLNAVVLHRVHRRVRVDPLMSIYATVLPPWNRAEMPSVGLTPVISLSVKNTIPPSHGPASTFSLTAVTATHRPQWSVSEFPLGCGSMASLIPAEVQRGCAHSLLLTLHCHPFQYEHLASEGKELNLVEDNCLKCSNAAAQTTSGGNNRNFDPFALESLEARNFLLRTSVIQVGRMGGEPLGAASMSMYVDGGAKNKGKGDGSDAPEVPLTEEQKRQKAIALEKHIYGRSLVQYTPIALTIHWSLVERVADDRTHAEQEIVRRGRLYHWIDPLAFLAALRHPSIHHSLPMCSLTNKSISSITPIKDEAEEDDDGFSAEMKGNWQARAARREQQLAMCRAMTERTAYTNTYQQDHVYRGAMAYRVRSSDQAPHVAYWESVEHYKSRTKEAYESSWWTDASLRPDGKIAAVSIPVTVEISSFSPLPVLVNLFSRLEENMFLPLSMKAKTFSSCVRHPSFFSTGETSTLHSDVVDPVWVPKDDSSFGFDGTMDNEGAGTRRSEEGPNLDISSFFYNLRVVLKKEDEVDNGIRKTVEEPENEANTTINNYPAQKGMISSVVILPGDSIQLHGYIRILVLEKLSCAAGREVSSIGKTLPLSIDTNIFYLKMKTLFFLPPTSGVCSGMSLQALLAVLTKMTRDEQQEIQGEAEENLSSDLTLKATSPQNGSFGGSLANSLRAAAVSAAAGGGGSSLHSSLGSKNSFSLLSCFNPPGFPSSQIAILGGAQSSIVQVLLMAQSSLGASERRTHDGCGSQRFGHDTVEEHWGNAAETLSRRCGMRFDESPDRTVYSFSSRAIGILTSDQASQNTVDNHAIHHGSGDNIKETPLPIWCASNARFQSYREKVWFPMLQDISDSVYFPRV